MLTQKFESRMNYYQTKKSKLISHFFWDRIRCQLPFEKVFHGINDDRKTAPPPNVTQAFSVLS